MKRLKTMILLLFLILLMTPVALNWTTSSQTSRQGTTNTQAATAATQATDTSTAAADGIAVGADQANRASNTGVDVTESRAVDTEGSDPDSDTNFSFDAEKDPAGASSSSPAPATASSSKNQPTRQSAGTQAGAAPASCWIPFSEAPADFDNQTNTFLLQSDFDADKALFEKQDEITPDGLGPVYNAQSCRECHQSPVTGAISQITELRAGHNQKVINPWGQVVAIFVDAPGGSLINDRSIPTKNNLTPPVFSAKVQERVPPLLTAGIVSGPALTADEPVRTFRTSLNTLGDGFLEAVPNGTLLAIAAFQNIITGGVVRGQAIAVPVLEANINTNPDCGNPNLNCVRRIGRFGWKDQHASLLSFSGDAYRNEIGITNFLIRSENTSLGRFIGFGSGFDAVADTPPLAEDTTQDFRAFTDFMRSTKAPPRDPDITNDPNFAASVQHGKQLFSNMPAYGTDHATYSCSICHVPALLTAPPCTVINGGQFTVPAALGNKIIRPFTDGLLHDVGTGDGIVQNGPQEDTVQPQWSTRNKVRTPPLWGVRTRDRLLHDGSIFTFMDAIKAHKGEAQSVIYRFNNLLPASKNDLIRYLETL
jgi:CxxC motif-containing protein (DUF1111 family)